MIQQTLITNRNIGKQCTYNNNQVKYLCNNLKNAMLQKFRLNAGVPKFFDMNCWAIQAFENF